MAEHAHAPKGNTLPPSTLAAQLVENISTSSRSSRSDDNELKNLFALIERVKDNPSLLCSHEKRILHNHMLIYVYCRVTLETIRLGDPLVDWHSMHPEIIKAIDFVRFTISETPTVLKLSGNGSGLMYRGPEPLWVWLLPNILKFLGHDSCLELREAIEGFLQYLMALFARNNALWGLADPLCLYLRACLAGLLNHLQDPTLVPSRPKFSTSLRLPPSFALEQLLDGSSPRHPQRTSFAITSASQALRQASSFAEVLAYPLTSPDSSFSYAASVSQNAVWLMDTWLDMRQVQRKWETVVKDSPMRLIESALNVAKSGLTEFLKSKAYVVLVLLCSEIISCPTDLIQLDESGEHSRLVYCKALVAIAQSSRESHVVSRLAASKLVHELGLLSSQHASIGPGTDLWKCTRLLHHVVYTSDNAIQATDVDFSDIEDEELSASFKKLQLPRQASTAVVVNDVKKRKLSSQNEERRSGMLQEIHKALNLEKLDDLGATSFEEQFLLGFERATESQQCIALDFLSRLCCAADESISPPDGESSDIECTICDGIEFPASKVADTAKTEVRTIFTKLLETSSFQKSKRPRVVAMLVLRTLVLHCESHGFLNLNKSGFEDLEQSRAGQWCLQSLITSSTRELRIAAGRTLAIYLSRHSHGFDEITFEQDCQYVIAVLKETSDKIRPHMVETRVMAWGQLGRHVPDNELTVVLVQLVEYLGSRNCFVSACAFNELSNLARARSTTPRKLFEPFWKSLGYMVVKDIIHRPQQSRVMAELLQMSINDLLLLIQSYVLPWLVLDTRLDVIQKIAEARGESETWRPLTDGPNLASILALLLVQDVEDLGDFTKGRLNAISPHFHQLTLADLFLSEPVLIAIELLRAAAEAEEDAARYKKIHGALSFVASTILKSNHEAKYKKGTVVGRFLQPHVLGLMTRLTDVINESVSPHQPLLEQRGCIRAMEEMIKVGKTYVRIARPQISACLLSAMSHKALRQASFSCWAAMLRNLGNDDVQALIETTFFIASHFWSSFNQATITVVTDTVNFLFDEHEKIIEAYAHRLPFLGHTGLIEAQKRLALLLRPLSTDDALDIFAQRISHDNSGVVHLALGDLVRYLRQNTSALYTLAVGQRPDSAIPHIMRALLDCACKYNGIHTDTSCLCVESLGLIGCVDSNRIEAVREQGSIVVLDNFQKAQEVTDFCLFLLQQVLVPAFLSATDTRLQGFLSFAMQELLNRCGIKDSCAMQDNGIVDGNDVYKKWIALPEKTREVLTPFLSSRYMVAPMATVKVEYPIFHPGKPYGNWLRSFVIDLLRRGQGQYADALFEPLTRVVRVKDLSAAEFLLPYLVMHVMIGTKNSKGEGPLILRELMSILQYQPPEGATYMAKEEMKKFCHAVFRILDYAMRWIHAKRAEGDWKLVNKDTVSYIQGLIDQIPPELVSERAQDCNEYARALFHLEQHASKLEQQSQPGDRNRMLERLQDIYANIDEPDGLQGISAHLHALDLNQQILSHKKAGRWTAAQTWYEMKLAEKPDDVDARLDLLTCLKQAGQHDALLNHVGGMQADPSSDAKIMPFAVEASWVTGRWDALVNFRHRFPGSVVEDFNLSIAALLESLHTQSASELLAGTIRSIRSKIASEMTVSATGSLQAAHGLLVKCHALADFEMVVASKPQDEEEKRKVMELLDGRLDILGAYFQDKQYVLGIRRATMELLRPSFEDADISTLWLTSARIARKTNSLPESFNAVLHALRLEDEAAAIENAKLLWREKHPREAIQVLQGAIEHNTVIARSRTMTSSAELAGLTPHQKIVAARAQLLLAKWLDAAGQSHAGALREKYQQPPKTHPTWEKGHFYLGRHYKKILESEQPLRSHQQSDSYVTGEISRLVIENYVRALNCGTKYLYQTLPRILTLWLDLGAQTDKTLEDKSTVSRELHKRRMERLAVLHGFLDKYIHRLPAYIFYTALPQIMARIAHPNVNVFERLTAIIVKVVEAYPQQALWSLMGIMTIRQASERKARGAQILQAVRGIGKGEGGSNHIKHMVRSGERLAEQLLVACQNGDFQSNKTVHASLGRELGFQHKCTPCPLVVPVESSLTATLPTVSEHTKKHNAFSRDVVTIDSFLDEVLVLSSLARPRRLTARGSDGNKYMLLIKPKDDLRTDQRLMEFNGIINGSLKRDVESSRRQLYIRTYAVVPLNEECGIIEWVPGIKALRDVILAQYTSLKIYPDYHVLRQLMDEAASAESKTAIFTTKVLGLCPPVLPMWFVQQFPSPAAWFAARLRYTRSCAVMSMVGTILGLGDRHGENINLEEGNGGVFHVDFNCLFDKGKTFAKPERVPFRLTHNMVAAMGIYGYEGPFRKSCELTLGILRQQEETLMTILEAFVYDPTLDLQRDKRAARGATLRLQPQSVLDSIKRKVRGLPPGESIPLSIEGQVDELIRQAVDARNLTAMYIGWCPFF